jgi:type IV secretion system protein VirB6
MPFQLEFFATFFASLDTVLTGFVAQAVQNMAQYVSTAIRIYGIVVLILAAIQLVWAPLPTAITKYGQTLFLIALLGNVATVPATYNSVIGTHLMRLPDDLLTALDPQGMGSAGDIGRYLDLKIGSMIQGVLNMWGACSWANFGGILLSLSMFGLLCMLSVAMVISITVGKVGIALVVAIGPLMIISLISEKSRDFFSKWLSYALMFAVLQLLIGGVMLIADQILTVYGAVLNPTTGNPSPQNLGGMFAPATAMLVLTYLFSQLPQMASSLTGGIGISAGNLAWDTLNRQRGFGGGDNNRPNSKPTPTGGGSVSAGSNVDPRAANAVMRGSSATRRRDAGARVDGPRTAPLASGSQSALARLTRQKQQARKEGDQ